MEFMPASTACTAGKNNACWILQNLNCVAVLHDSSKRENSSLREVTAVRAAFLHVLIMYDRQNFLCDNSQ